MVLGAREQVERSGVDSEWIGLDSSLGGLLVVADELGDQGTEGGAPGRSAQGSGSQGGDEAFRGTGLRESR